MCMQALTRSTIAGLIVLLFVATARVSPAEPLPRSKPPAWRSYAVTSIHSILSDPGHYQFRLVRIRGVVQSITQVPQPTTCGFGGGRGVGYTIRVRDASGELTLIDGGPCGRNHGPVFPETLAGGEPIEAFMVVSYINVPGQDPTPPEGVLQWLERSE